VTETQTVRDRMREREISHPPLPVFVNRSERGGGRETKIMENNICTARVHVGRGVYTEPYYKVKQNVYTCLHEIYYYDISIWKRTFIYHSLYVIINIIIIILRSWVTILSTYKRIQIYKSPDILIAEYTETRVFRFSSRHCPRFDLNL